MTLSSATNSNDYTGAGTLSIYDYDFMIFADTDLVVTVADTDNVETILTITTDYTVTDAGESAGGTVVLVDAAQDWLDGDGDLKTDYKLNIRRVRPLTQETDIRNQGDFFPETYEDALDHIVMVCQQLQEQIDRAVISGATQDTVTVETLADSIAAAAVAQAAAEAAQAGAEAAETNAETAETNAEAAKTNAETAETNAETAETNAEAAQVAAEAAQVAAEAATGVKGWINFNGTGVIAIKGSLNVTSITDNGTGAYYVTWDTDFSDGNYAAPMSSNTDEILSAGEFAGYIDVRTRDKDGVATDASTVMVIASGDQ